MSDRRTSLDDENGGCCPFLGPKRGNRRRIEECKRKRLPDLANEKKPQEITNPQQACGQVINVTGRKPSKPDNSHTFVSGEFDGKTNGGPNEETSPELSSSETKTEAKVPAAIGAEAAPRVAAPTGNGSGVLTMDITAVKSDLHKDVSEKNTPLISQNRARQDAEKKVRIASNELAMIMSGHTTKPQIPEEINQADYDCMNADDIIGMARAIGLAINTWSDLRKETEENRSRLRVVGEKWIKTSLAFASTVLRVAKVRFALFSSQSLTVPGLCSEPLHFGYIRSSVPSRGSRPQTSATLIYCLDRKFGYLWVGQ